MGGHKGIAVSGGTGEQPADDSRPPIPRTRNVFGSLMWAVLLPGAMILGSALGQWVIWVGATLMLVAIAVAACLIGGFWHRAGAATLAAACGFALTLFAGPAVYEVYMKTFGEPVAAVVTEVTDRHNRRGPDMFCSIEETGAGHRTYEVSQQQNCFGQAKVGDRVEIRKDPLGLLDPRLPDSPDQRGTTEITVQITAGLTLLTAATVFYAGLRRRTDQAPAAAR
ncbi:hypothetical protein [Streptomyces sp. NBC_01565]|uniref:hypothetical protein n=1 Tax=unclassified Streptomyces TaxID=2593676 RepID=UPI0022580A49|nr:hypothetical protein [Streptomyces sp. NBC_01565]MCX4539453.1 hypothetical protein [Streptomyces sp. NBC_01565]